MVIEKDREPEDKTDVVHKITSGIGLVLCVVFGFLLVCNLIIIVKGTMDPKEPPSVFGSIPLVVLSGSMSGPQEGHIETGDLIVVSAVETKNLQEGDVIAFMEPNSTVIVTHRIIEIHTESNGALSFITKGDANNTPDQVPVDEKQVVGIYKFRIPKVGDFAIFMQKPLGMMIFIGIPLLAFIIYDVLRRQHYANQEKKNLSEMEAELERLRALTGEKSTEGGKNTRKS